MQLNKIFSLALVIISHLSTASAEQGALDRFMASDQNAEPIELLAQSNDVVEESVDSAAKPNAISQLLVEIENQAEREGGEAKEGFSLLADSELIRAYDYLKINDTAGFLKIINRRLLNSEDDAEKARLNYWAGEAQIKLGEQKKAANNFLEGYKADLDGMYGAYNLFGLAIAMRDLDKKDESCSAIMKLKKSIEQEEVLVPKLFVERLVIAAKSCEIGSDDS